MSASWTLARAEEYLLGLELFGMHFGLERMHRLTTTLGMPQRRFASVHVVGSNGKSSTVRFTAAVLERHGLRTGSYTSPHLASFRERIEVGEQPVSGERFAAAVERAARAAEIVERAQPDDEDLVTQFEALTAAAYHELAASKVEVAVIEAGLGGRYDATNVIPSKVAVLTGVGLEHTRWLGPTIGDIAEEKLAVVSDHSALVTAPLDPAARAVAERVAGERHAHWIDSPALVDVPLRAAGAFQRQNFALACAAAEAFLGRALDPGAVADAAAATRIPGRLDPMSERPAGAPRRRPQPGRRARAGAGAAGGPGAPAPARPGGQRARGQGRRGHAGSASGPVRPGGVHALLEPTLAVAGHARIAGRADGRASRADRPRARGRGRAARGRWPAPTAPWWSPDRST